ncbi:unnamed protein product, partial [marine sediment metagenome]
MKMKLTCGLIIFIFICNAFVVSWNNGYDADAPESNPQEISRNVPKPLSNGVFNWSKIKVISEPVSGRDFDTRISYASRIAVENDKIYVVWWSDNNTNGAGTDDDVFYRHFDGNNWADIQVISEPVIGQNINTGRSGVPDIAVENGKIYVVWQDLDNTNGAGNNDVDIFYRCNLTGTSWEPVQVISEPIFGKNMNIGHSWSPKIAVENGKIYVVWDDVNNTNNAGNDRDMFYRCNITGFGWEPVQIISEPVSG